MAHHHSDFTEELQPSVYAPCSQAEPVLRIALLRRQFLQLFMPAKTYLKRGREGGVWLSILTSAQLRRMQKGKKAAISLVTC